MVRASASSSSRRGQHKETEAAPDVLGRKRLKKLALSNRILSETEANDYCPLSPSRTVVKHQGKDILRKSQRKNRFLFSFPGLLAPIGSGGTIGDLKDLGTKNPILYLRFPQGQIKLFGTIVYPKNRYLTLQFSRSGKNVMCEDYFDNMIVFSDAWWIGTKEENPEEAKLDFPKELFKGQDKEYDFKGGAGVTSLNKKIDHKPKARFVEEEFPETELENDLTDDENKLNVLEEATPTRHSERTAGKRFKFAEVSSGDDSVEADTDIFCNVKREAVKNNAFSMGVLDTDEEIALKGNQFKQVDSSAISKSKSTKLSESSTSVKSDEEDLPHNRGSLVQTTISTLFKKVQEKDKVEEKNLPRISRKSQLSKDSGQTLKQTELKRKNNEVEGHRKSTIVTDGRKAGTRTKAKKKVVEDDDDDDSIQEFSSSSQGTAGSDEDWTA